MDIHIKIQEKLYTDSNVLIADYMPFIIKTISQTTNKYVSLENDDTFSIGLYAFYEAINKFNPDKGAFVSFAGLVIKSRLLTYLSSQQKHQALAFIESYDDLDLSHYQVTYLDTTLDSQDLLKDEIQLLNETLSNFRFTLNDLALDSPKHQKTRDNAITIGEKVSCDKPLVKWMYEKSRLPITQISLKYQVTQKVLKGSKKFIITIIIILDKNLSNLKRWIRK